MVVGDVRACAAWSISSSGSASSSIPCAAATAFPSSTRPETSARRSGRSQTRPWVRPVSAPIGFVEALKITLRHCGPRASSTACAGIPARVHASASRSTSASGVRSSYGPSVVSPFTSHCTCPGSSSFPAGKVVPRITRSTCSGDRLLVAEPVLDGGDAAVREGVRGRRDRRLGVHRLRRDDAEVARRELGGVARRARAARRRRRRRRAAARRG